jgi:hypothetical protein
MRMVRSRTRPGEVDEYRPLGEWNGRQIAVSLYKTPTGALQEPP